MKRKKNVTELKITRRPEKQQPITIHNVLFMYILIVFTCHKAFYSKQEMHDVQSEYDKV